MVLCLCSPLEFLEILFDFRRIGAMTRILHVKLFKQIKFRVVWEFIHLPTFYWVPFKPVATCMKAIVINS